MKRITWLIMIGMLIMLVACSNNEEPAEQVNHQTTTEGSEVSEDINQLAESFITLLAEGKFAEASEYGDETITADDLKHTWETIQQQLGDMIEQEHSTTTELNSLDVVMIIGHFEATQVMFNISFNQDQQIAGFYVQ